jgi:hypothetical protein
MNDQHIIPDEELIKKVVLLREKEKLRNKENYKKKKMKIKIYYVHKSTRKTKGPGRTKNL